MHLLGEIGRLGVGERLEVKPFLAGAETQQHQRQSQYIPHSFHVFVFALNKITN
jgi:hypothetical protein